MDLIFATNNKHKVEEVKSVVPSSVNIITLKEAGIDIEIPEPHPTLQENAAEKGKTIFSITKKNCFSEDTGLEVFSLGGEPGVRSARYAGDEASSQKNIEKLLARLEDKEDRTAQFRTVIYLIWRDKEYFFEGICKGEIVRAAQGVKGFGYDPVFVPEGAQKTFAEMTMDEKNSFSHRQKAVTKLVEFLNHLNVND